MASNRCHYYHCDISVGHQYIQIAQGGDPPSCSTLSRKPYNFEINNWYAVRVEVEGIQYRAYVDDMLVLDLEDNYGIDGECFGLWIMPVAKV